VAGVDGEPAREIGVRFALRLINLDDVGEPKRSCALLQWIGVVNPCSILRVGFLWFVFGLA
jgi:hypothetical protein